MGRVLTFYMAALLIVYAPAAYSSEYSQPGFYDVNHLQLENGMHVILKPRHYARNVAIDLHVNIGHLNFPCGKRETAHFLEHLLFTGTSRHIETELEELVESHGGSWNAQTSNEYTLYSMEIFSKHMDVGLNTLHEIITDSTISEENVEKSRNIVFREDGGRPSAIREWLYSSGIIQSTYTRLMNGLFPGVNYRCMGLDETTKVTREDVLNAYRDYYIASNMTLVLVGDFDSKKAIAQIKQTFGTMPKRSMDSVKPRPLPKQLQSTPDIIEGRLDPLVGSEASIYFTYRIGGVYSPHYFALNVMEKYFQTELYNKLRIEQGMAYYPDAYTVVEDDYGAFVLETDAELDDVTHSIEVIKDTINQFKQGKLDEERLEKVKQKILLNTARGYESNASFAQYYAMTVEDVKRFGKYRNYEEQVESVNIEDIRNAANAYFSEENLLIAVVRPTLSYTQFYLIVIAVVLLVALVVWRVVVKIRNKPLKSKTIRPVDNMENK